MFNQQLHKRIDVDLVKFLFHNYLSHQVSLKQITERLKIRKTRFYELLHQFKNNPDEFSLEYQRKTRKKISPELEKMILNELEIDKKIIKDLTNPVRTYNYTFIRDQIFNHSQLKISVPTIIKRAKEYGYYKAKPEQNRHDREVITHYPGELIQHDSSKHKFSPYADKYWYLITSLDDYSRYLMCADLVEQETSWAHILALESVILRFGIPLAYYVDSHSIFRFVQGRDSVWRNHKQFTDQISPQFKQVLEDLHIEIKYALSPQAKGKIERPYRWLQDRLVRTCAREHITDIADAKEILRGEVLRYNERQLHSTTKEIPIRRLEKAIREKRTLFREFKIPSPYESTKDIFCFRLKKKTDAYHKVRINKMDFYVKGVPCREEVDIRIVPDREGGISELRFWYKGKLVAKQLFKLNS